MAAVLSESSTFAYSAHDRWQVSKQDDKVLRAPMTEPQETKCKTQGHNCESQHFVIGRTSLWVAGNSTTVAILVSSKLGQAELIKNAWSSDGNILVKDNTDCVYSINSLGNPIIFGLLVFATGKPPSNSRRQRGPWPANVIVDRHFAAEVRNPPTGDHDMLESNES